MKILLVIDSFFPNVDGPNVVVASVAGTLNKNGAAECELLVPSYPEKIGIDGLKITRCKSLPSNEDYRMSVPAFDRKIKKLIKNGGFDVIHIHSPFPLGRYARKLGKKYGIPVIFTMHTKFKDEFERRLKFKPLISFMMKYIMGCINKCDYVTTVSEGAVNTLKEYGYKRCGDVEVIRNATNMPKNAADLQTAEKLRKIFSPDGEFVFLYVGRLAQTKNIQFSLKVLAAVKERGYTNFRFVIVGDGDYGKTLKKLAADLNLTDNVYFTGKISDKNLIACYYKAGDLFMFPSDFDTAGIVILEAAANSLASAVFEGSCAAEPVTDRENGFVFERDEKGWVEGIIKILDNPSLAKRAGESALNGIYTDWNGVSGQYLALYERVAAEKNRP